MIILLYTLPWCSLKFYFYEKQTKKFFTGKAGLNKNGVWWHARTPTNVLMIHVIALPMFWNFMSIMNILYFSQLQKEQTLFSNCQYLPTEIKRFIYILTFFTQLIKKRSNLVLVRWDFLIATDIYGYFDSLKILDTVYQKLNKCRLKSGTSSIKFLNCWGYGSGYCASLKIKKYVRQCLWKSWNAKM